MHRAVEDAPAFIKQNIGAMIDSGGKMLRPTLVLLAGKYVGKNLDNLYQLAAAIEFLHTATLIHDDILDDAPTRRGRNSLFVGAGIKAAVLIGDYMFARCFSLMDPIIEKSNGLGLAQAVERICEGEINQNSDRFKLDTGLRAYRRRISSKTAVLIAASLSLGADQGGCDEREIQRFRRIGYDLGMAFQIVDDLLDFDGEAAETGKPVGRDLAAGIFTAPLLYSLQSEYGDELRDLLGRTPYADETVRRAVELTRLAGGVVRARELAAYYTDHARREINGLYPGETRTELLRLADALLMRRA